MKTTIDFKGQKKFTRTINFYKKQSNWNKILMQAGKNVAEDIKQDGVDRLFTKYNNVTGRLKSSFTSAVTRRGNNVFITFKSNHPAAGIMEYGGYLKKIPAFTDDYNTNLNPYSKQKGDMSKEDANAFLAEAIYESQPFKEGTFAFTNARRDGIKALEGEVIRVANRMKK
tara:strand:+ start:4 stop:513 length:510 start_codon:yes stop_codon:yes gene_type:complete